MFILYNNQLLQEQELSLPLTNRAFQYNDGFFETAILVDGQIRFWNDHLQRMQEAAAALQLELPPYFMEEQFKGQLLQLAQQEVAVKYGRLKLKVWRAGAGLYTPQSNAANWLATAQPTSPAPAEVLHIGVCKNIHTAYTPFSHFKGPNAPLYVLAAIEKQEAGLDDMLLLSASGHVAELISSNIFWLKDEVIYTPHLQSGCVNGILRRNIMRWGQSIGITVQEVHEAVTTILKADAVFAVNVTGIRSIASIAGTHIAQNEHFVDRLRRKLML